MTDECKDCYQNSGWQYPNLGVNIPAGCAWAMGSSFALYHMGITGFPWVKCKTCNSDGLKPRPQDPRSRSRLLND